jgi:selenium metabolism protein YedF
MQHIDARGKTCPQPVILTKNAIEAGATSLEILVDNAVARSNVSRFLEKSGYRAEVHEEGTDFRIVGEGTPPAAATEVLPELPDAYTCGNASLAVLLTSKTLGKRDEALGDVLMKAFLGTLSQGSTVPETIALMNEGVMLALPENSTSESLEELQAKGTQILVCGTCTKHFGVTEQIRLGTISNMFDIVEALRKAGKILSVG